MQSGREVDLSSSMRMRGLNFEKRSWEALAKSSKFFLSFGHFRN